MQRLLLAMRFQKEEREAERTAILAINPSGRHRQAHKQKKGRGGGGEERGKWGGLRLPIINSSVATKPPFVFFLGGKREGGSDAFLTTPSSRSRGGGRGVLGFSLI